MHAWGLRLRGVLRMLALAHPPVLPSAIRNDVGTPVAIVSQLDTLPACAPVNASLQPCGRPRTATPVPGLKRTRNRTHARFWRLGASRKSHHRSGQIFPAILNGRDSIPSAFRILIASSMSEQFMLMMPRSAFGLACTRIVFFKMSIARPASPGGSTQSLQISGIGFLR